MGHSILGDRKYGSKDSLPDKNIALAATAISFKTATENRQIDLSIPLPEEWGKYLP